MRELNVFNNCSIFMSTFSFKQNKEISKELRIYVKSLLTEQIKYLVCIGGESYLFGLCSDNIYKIFHYTNSSLIYDDANYNNYFYKKKIENNLIDYNTFKNIKNGNVLILNLAKLNLNILYTINKRYYKYIIIINCHHNEFWNRIKYLTNYKLKIRKQFVTSNHFITVNLLKYKYYIPKFIPIGDNCSIAYQLNKIGLRFDTFPFDWSKLNVNKLNKVLESKFQNYNNIKIKKYSLIHKYLSNTYGTISLNNIGSYIVTNSYNIEFAHELHQLSNNNKYLIENLKKKIDERVYKFKNLYTSNEKIIFILLNSKYNNINFKLLINNLNIYAKNFKLICINLKNPIYIPDKYSKIIKIYNLSTDFTDWTYSNLNWFEILFNN